MAQNFRPRAEEEEDTRIQTPDLPEPAQPAQPAADTDTPKVREQQYNLNEAKRQEYERNVRAAEQRRTQGGPSPEAWDRAANTLSNRGNRRAAQSAAETARTRQSQRNQDERLIAGSDLKRQQHDIDRQREDEQRRTAQQAEAARRHAAAGGETLTDPATGRSTIAAHPDGAPKFKAGPVEGSQPTLKNTPENVAQSIPFLGQMAKPAAKPHEAVQEMRNDRGQTAMVPVEEKTDPKTGETYAETKDQFGQPSRLTTGTDPNIGRKLEIQRNLDLTTLQRQNLDIQKARIQPQWQQVERTYQAAKKQLDTPPKYIQVGNGQWVTNDEKQFPVSTEEGERWKKERQAVVNQYKQAARPYGEMQPAWMNLQQQERETKQRTLELEAQKMRLDLGLPDDDGGTAATLTQVATGESSVEQDDILQHLATVPGYGEVLTMDNIQPALPEGAQLPTAPLIPQDDPGKAAMFAQAFGGNLANAGEITVGSTGNNWSLMRRDGANIGSLDVDAETQTPRVVIDSRFAPADLLQQVTTGTTSGIDIYLREPTAATIKPRKEVEWIAGIYQAIGAAPDPDAVGGILDSMQASPDKIVAKVNAGELSLQRGEALMRDLYGSTLKAEDPTAPESFEKWIYGEAPKETRDAWAAAQASRSTAGKNAVKQTYLDAWQARNAWKPGVTLAQRVAAEKALSLPPRTGEQIAGMADALAVTAIQSVAMLSQTLSPVIAPINALINPGDNTKWAKQVGRATANDTRMLQRSATRYATAEGKQAFKERDIAREELRTVVMSQDNYAGGRENPEWKAAYDAAIRKVTDNADKIHGWNREDGWQITREDIDPATNESLRNIIETYAVTGNPDLLESFMGAQLEDHGTRQAAKYNLDLAAGRNKYAAAWVQGTHASLWETATEVGSTVLTAGIGKALYGAGKAATGVKAAAQMAKLEKAAAAGSRLARFRLAMHGIKDEYLKAGLVPNTLAKPATTLGKAQNIAVKGLKFAAAAAPAGFVEEGVMGLANPDASVNTVLHDAMLGAVLEPLLGGVMAVPAIGASAITRNIQVSRATAKFADAYNREFNGTEGFIPLSPQKAQAAMALFDGVNLQAMHGRLAESVQNVIAATEAASVENAGPAEVHAMHAALAAHRELTDNISENVFTRLEAVQSIDALKPEERPLAYAIAKVASGRPDLVTPQERAAAGGVSTTTGAPVFATGPNGLDTLTPEGRAMAMERFPTVGMLIQTAESQAIFENAGAQAAPLAPITPGAGAVSGVSGPNTQRIPVAPETQQRAEAITSSVMQRIQAQAPGLAARLSAVEADPAQVSGGVIAAGDNIHLVPEDIAQLIESAPDATDEQIVESLTDTVALHEITHVGDRMLEVAKARAAGDTRDDFEIFKSASEEFHAAVSQENPELLDIAAQLYARQKDGTVSQEDLRNWTTLPTWKQGAETKRMFVEAMLEGRTTDVNRFLSAATAKVREILVNLARNIAELVKTGQFTNENGETIQLSENIRARVKETADFISQLQKDPNATPSPANTSSPNPSNNPSQPAPGQQGAGDSPSSQSNSDSGATGDGAAEQTPSDNAGSPTGPTAEVKAARKLINERIAAALEAMPYLKRDAGLIAGIVDAAFPLAESIANLTTAEQTFAVNAAIREYLKTPETAPRVASLIEAYKTKRAAYNRARQSRIDDKAREAINANPAGVLYKILEAGRIIPPPLTQQEESRLKQKAKQGPLTEEEYAKQRGMREYNGFPYYSDMLDHPVAIAARRMLLAEPGDTTALSPDTVIDGMSGSELWTEVAKELEAIRRGYEISDDNRYIYPEMYDDLQDVEIEALEAQYPEKYPRDPDAPPTAADFIEQRLGDTVPIAKKVAIARKLTAIQKGRGLPVIQSEQGTQIDQEALDEQITKAIDAVLNPPQRKPAPAKPKQKELTPQATPVTPAKPKPATPSPAPEKPLSSFIETGSPTATAQEFVMDEDTGQKTKTQPVSTHALKLWNSLPKLIRGNFPLPGNVDIDSLAPFSLAGNKAALIKHFMLPILTRLARRSKRVLDIFGGAGTYTHVLSQAGVLPKGSMLNEYEWHRALTHKWTKEDPVAVAREIVNFRRILEQEAAPKSDAPEMLRKNHARLVNQWLQEQIDPNEELQRSEWENYSRVPMKDEARTAALYMIASGAAFGNRPLEVTRSSAVDQMEMFDGDMPQFIWTEGVDEKGKVKVATTDFLAQALKPTGYKFPARILHAETHLRAASKRLADVTILGPWDDTHGDAMQVLDKYATAGDLIPYDPPYLPNVVTGKTGNYGLGSGIFGRPDKALQFIKKHAQPAAERGALIVSTNNYDPHFVAGLSSMNWQNVGAYRAGTANLQDSELISISEPIFSPSGESSDVRGNFNWHATAAGNRNEGQRAQPDPSRPAGMAPGSAGSDAVLLEGQGRQTSPMGPADVRPEGESELPGQDDSLEPEDGVDRSEIGYDGDVRLFSPAADLTADFKQAFTPIDPKNPFGKWAASTTEDGIIYGYRGENHDSGAFTYPPQDNGFGGSEGVGLYVAKTKEDAGWFGPARQVAFPKPKRPIILDRQGKMDPPWPLMNEEDDAVWERVFSHEVKPDDSDWMKAHILAAKEIGLTEDTYSEKIGQMPRALTDKLLAMGYDSVYVRIGGMEWVNILAKKGQRHNRGTRSPGGAVLFSPAATNNAPLWERHPDLQVTHMQSGKLNLQPSAQYNYLKAKQDKAGLTPAENEALLQAEKAMGQTFAFDMDREKLRAPRGTVANRFQPFLRLESQAQAPDERQMALFSPAQSRPRISAAALRDPSTARIFTGATHGDANPRDKALLDLGKDDDPTRHIGFVDENGNWISPDAALELYGVDGSEQTAAYLMDPETQEEVKETLGWSETKIQDEIRKRQQWEALGIRHTMEGDMWSDDMSIAEPPAQRDSARHAALEAKHNAGTITPEETAEAERIVEERAKGAGYVVKAYHAGTVVGITEFRPLTHFGSDIRQLEGIKNRRKALKEKPADAEYAVFLKLQNPKRVDDTFNWGDRMSEAISEGHDGLVYKNYGEGFNTDEGATFKDSFIPAYPNQIKSADPFTGVPLDQRFDYSNPSILYSPAAEPNPGNQAAADAALANLAPIFKDVLRASMATPTPNPAQLAKQFNLSERAIQNILSSARARIRAFSATQSPEGLQTQTMPDGRLKGGLPHRAFSAEPGPLAAVDQLQQQEGLPLGKTDADIRAGGQRILDSPNALDLAIAAHREGMPSAEQTYAAQQLLLNSQIRGNTDPKITELAILYRERGTEMSDAFRARRDVHRTPAERNALIFAETFAEPDKATRKAYTAAKTDAERQAILQAWNAKVKGLKEAMIARGVDIDAALQAVGQQLDDQKSAQDDASARHQQLVDALNAEVTKLRERLASAQDEAAKASTEAKLAEAEKNAAEAAALDPAKTLQLELSRLNGRDRGIIEEMLTGATFEAAAANYGVTVKEAVAILRNMQKRLSDAASRAAELAYDIMMGTSETLGSPAALNAAAPRPNFRSIGDAVARGIVDVDAMLRRSQPATAKTKGKAAKKADTRPDPAMMSDEEFTRRQNNPDTHRPLWQFEMATTRPQNRITFDEWQAKPEVKALKQRQERMWKQPVSTTTGTLDMHDRLSVKRAYDMLHTLRASWFDKAIDFWRMSILSGPQTGIVNFGGNVVHSAYHLGPRRILEAGVNDVLGIIGLGSKDAATLGELKYMARRTQIALAKAGSDMIRSWNLDDRIVEQEVLALNKQIDFSGIGADYIPRALGGKLGDIMHSISFRHMTAADEMLKSFHGHMDVAAHAYRMAKKEGLKGAAFEKRMDELLEYGSAAWVKAYESSEYVTFQTPEEKTTRRTIGIMDKAAAALRRASTTETDTKRQITNKDGKKVTVYERKPNALAFFFPFIKTPLNIFKIGIEMTPVGGFLAVVDSARALKERIDKKHITPQAAQAAAAEIYNRAEFVKDLTNQIIGAGVFWALGSLLKGDDDEPPYLTGSTDWKRTSKGARDIEFRVMPPYSIRLGDSIFSYQRIEPFGTALGLLVDLRLAVETEGGFNDRALGRFIGTFINQLDNKTYLKGVSDIFNAVHDPERFASKLASGVITGFVPNLIRQPIREADPYVRDIKPGQDDGFATAIAKQIGYSLAPGYAPIRLDVWGRPVLRNNGQQLGTPQTDVLLRVFDPLNTTIGNQIDPLDIYLFKWNTQAEPKDRFNIEPIQRTLQASHNGQTYKLELTPEEHEAANKNAGQAAHKMLTDSGRFTKGTTPAEQDVEYAKTVVRRYQNIERDKLRAAKLREVIK